MRYGRTGIKLEIDLSRGTIEKKESDPKLAEAYLGGKGTNLRLLWDRVPPELDAFSPDNPLVFGSGLLVGTPVPYANRGIISCKSPQFDFFIYSAFGGYWAAELKHAGYDTIVVTGKSPAPVYLWVNDDEVELRDASHIWGKDTFETQTMIREELARNEVQILCIGPAGENKLYGASVEHGNGASASRGVGAVMGDKNLKAVVAYGTKDIHIAKPAELFQLSDQIVKRSGKLRDWFDGYSKNVSKEILEWCAYGNVDEKLEYEDAEGLMAQFNEKFKTREVSCYNCPARCKTAICLPENKHPLYIKCGSWWFPAMSYKASESDFFRSNMRAYNLYEGYGLDTYSVTRCVAFVIDLYKNGILTKEDTWGMDLEYGNEEVSFQIVEKIVRREGIGDVLAYGTEEAARLIGNGAEQYACHNIKKQEVLPFELYDPHFALSAAVSEKSDLTRLEHWYPQYLAAFPTKEAKEAAIKEGWFNYPEEFQKWFLADYDPLSIDEEVAAFTDYNGLRNTVNDLTGLCVFCTGFMPFSPISPDYFSMVAEMISCSTGVDVDQTELRKIAGRVETLVRAYNLRLGLRRKDDTIPGKFFEKEPDPGIWSWYKKLDRGKFNKWLDDFYKLKGWNSDGIPIKETLDKLGLDYVGEDLERRGIM